MERKRFLLEGATLKELQERVISEHGGNATIIAAEKVTVGGIRGFFARQYYEVTVEVMEPVKRTKSAHAHLDISARLGIAALLDDADEVESRLYRAQPVPQVSTASDGFAKLMDDLTFATGSVKRTVASTRPELDPELAPDLGAAPGLGASPAPRTLPVPTAPHAPTAASTPPASSVKSDPGFKLDPSAPPESSARSEASATAEASAAAEATPVGPGRGAATSTPVRRQDFVEMHTPARSFVPVPLTGPGDVVLIVGLESEALTIAHLMLRVAGAGGLRTSGSLEQPGVERVDDRRGAMLARAQGVEIGHSMFIAHGLEIGSDGEAHGAALRAIDADQVWIVVDASRKTEDTRGWVNRVTSIVPVHAVAALGRRFTTSPSTVDELGLPVEWMDGRVAAAPTGRGAAAPKHLPGNAER